MYNQYITEKYILTVNVIIRLFYQMECSLH